MTVPFLIVLIAACVWLCICKKYTDSQRNVGTARAQPQLRLRNHGLLSNNPYTAIFHANDSTGVYFVRLNNEECGDCEVLPPSYETVSNSETNDIL